MSAVTKALKNSAKQIVVAAKTYANKHDGIADDWSDGSIASMLYTYIETLEGFQSNPVLGKIKYDKYISQVEKMLQPYLSSASAKLAVSEDGYVADAGNTEISVVGTDMNVDTTSFIG